MVLAGSRWALFPHCLMKKLRVGQFTYRLLCHLAPVSEEANVYSQWSRIPFIPAFGVSVIFVLVLGKKNYLRLYNQDLLPLHRGSRALNHSTGLISGLILALSSWLSKLSQSLTSLKPLLHVHTFIVLF